MEITIKLPISEEDWKNLNTIWSAQNREKEIEKRKGLIDKFLKLGTEFLLKDISCYQLGKIAEKYIGIKLSEDEKESIYFSFKNTRI
jgi:hypothetical protein